MFTACVHFLKRVDGTKEEHEPDQEVKMEETNAEEEN